MQAPRPTNGLRHVAFYAKHFEQCLHFYRDLIGMKVVWQPDEDNIYLSTGHDNLALHRIQSPRENQGGQRLDHIGFFLVAPEDVDQWHVFLCSQGVEIVAPPKNHRDGTRSFYCKDPDGNVVQMIFYPLP